jgi:hypothetical protein
MRDELEWTEDERAALEGLDREVDPGRLLEERTVAALRERGLLRSGGIESGRPGAPARYRRAPRHPAWWAAGIAAALALFFGGMTVGQARAVDETRDLVMALRTADAAERASWVQHTGSLYVEALTALAELQDGGDEAQLAAGAEVARAALRAAALELARMYPDDARYTRVLATLQEAVGPEAMDTASVEQVIWF